MSISTELGRIQENRNTIRDKLVELGCATSTDTLDVLATTIAGIINRGAVSVEILEGTTYTIPAGYHNGSGVVKAMTDVTGEAEKYKTQQKSVTPTKSQQNVVPDTGNYALSSVTVAAIPAAYQDVTSVTAAAGNVLAGKVFVTSDGKVVTGTMTNNGTVSKTLSGTLVSYTIPAGYHSGSGKVTITLEEKSVTPTKSAQDITPTSGNVLSKVTVAAIPNAYQDVTGVTATGGDVLRGVKFVAADGSEVQGQIYRHESDDVTMTKGEYADIVVSTEDDGTENTEPGYKLPVLAGYHDGTTFVSPYLSEKTVTPTESQQTVNPDTNTLLKKVTVKAIPSNYKNTSDATATAANVLVDKIAYNASGKITGSMPNNGAVTKTLDTTTKEYPIPVGYHNGSGKVSITTQSKTIEHPESKTENTTVSADAGKVLSEVVIKPLPKKYADISDASAFGSDYSHMFPSGYTVYAQGKNGSTPTGIPKKIEGTAPIYYLSNWEVDRIDGISTTEVTIPKGLINGSNLKVTFDDSKILEQLESI